MEIVKEDVRAVANDCIAITDGISLTCLSTDKRILEAGRVIEPCPGPKEGIVVSRRVKQSRDLAEKRIVVARCVSGTAGLTKE